MADLLAQGLQWLDAQRKQHLAKAVLYERGAQSVLVLATIGRTEFEVSDTEGVQTAYTDRDFLISTADLVLAGVVTLPEAGDRVKETLAASVEVYEVLDWRYSDPHRQILRIQTKHIASELL